MTIVAETPRLSLRRCERTDLDALARLFGDPEVMRFSLGVKTREETRQMLVERVFPCYRENGWGPWSVIHREDDALIGFVGLLPQQVDGRHEAEVAYRIARAYWGRGLGSEAALAARDAGLEQFGLTRLISIIEPTNLASIHIAEKNGMHLEQETTMWDRPARVYAIEIPAQIT